MAQAAAKVSADQKPFCKRLLSLTGRYSAWEVWSDFITAFALAISNAVDKTRFDEREAAYLHIMKRYDAQQREVFPALVADVVDALDRNPEQDFLGSMYMELGLGNNHTGQFFTPYDVCRAMAGLTVQGATERILSEGWVSLNDCACGAGATLIAACHEIGRRLSVLGQNWQNHVLVTAQDVDASVGKMCYIQLSLIGAAGYVKVGDSLANPMTEKDDPKNYWYTPMYFSDVWHYRRLCQQIDRLMRAGKATQEQNELGKEDENGSGNRG